MSYTDYSSHWQLDAFLTYLEANVLGSNDQHLYDTLAVEHNINTTTVDGTHKANSITGSMINTTPASSGSIIINSSTAWTPAVGVYQVICLDSGFTNILNLEIYVSGSWRTDVENAVQGILFFDGTNMRINNQGSGRTIYYQKF